MNDRLYSKPMHFFWPAEVLEEYVLYRRHSFLFFNGVVFFCFIIRPDNMSVRSLGRDVFSDSSYRLASRDILVALNPPTVCFSLSSVLMVNSFPTAASDTIPFHSQLHLLLPPNAPHHLPAEAGQARCSRSGACGCWTEPLRGRLEAQV
jgi:hypothetical protein